MKNFYPSINESAPEEDVLTTILKNIDISWRNLPKNKDNSASFEYSDVEDSKLVIKWDIESQYNNYGVSFNIRFIKVTGSTTIRSYFDDDTDHDDVINIDSNTGGWEIIDSITITGRSISIEEAVVDFDKKTITIS